MAVCMVFLLFLGVSTAEAQLSPGKLAQAHKNLEGLKKCGKCHKLGSQDVTPKCLACHVEIKTRQNNNRGLHAGSDFSQCVDCHVDHQGRDFELIHWPDGRENFDHKKTGYELQGAHQKATCRTCHKAGFNKDADQLKKLGKNLDRTYLGLDSQCMSCHEDNHQQQFASQCTSCHDQNQWKPAALFAHEKTTFPLTGLHGKVACEKCHVPKKLTQDKPAVQYTNIAHDQCTDCHSDPHENRLGSECISCHETTGWQNIRGEGFNHDVTRYKLEGKHKTVRCESCHSGERKKPAFDRCSGCHSDMHQGVSLGRPYLLKCETCHSVQGFKPSAYGQTMHQKSAFPLEGAHRAVACRNCHQKASIEAKWEMKLSHAACISCHADPHQGRMDKQAGDQSCIACHSQDSWQGSVFDHNRTSFKLTGAHGRVACASCHGSENKKMDKSECIHCHADPHRDQFKDIVLPDNKSIDCARCHVTVDWFAELFNHETDSRFPLRGGHQKVACATCHQVWEADKPRLLLYKPLSIECVACHKATPEIEEEKNEQ